jgi:REP element-mobilizing transposase RayT
MAQVRIWVHVVWSTKSRDPLLTNKNKRIDIFKHIKSNAKKKDIYLDFISGVADHVHVLISLACDQTIAQVIAWLKGESSRYINERKITATYFDWADDYYAVSVSQSNVETVRNYLKKQEDHHEKKTFAEECEEFMSKYGFVRMLG